MRLKIPMREFQNKTYWIVGASEGLGRALAIQLAKVGAKVIISARSEERLIGLSEEIGSNTMVLPMDVSDRSSVQKACSKLPRSLDGFIFVSGVYWHMSASSWDEIKAEEMVDINLVGAMRCLAHLVPKFINQGFGHIVLTGSIAGYRGLPGSVGYCASKAGLMSLAETLKIDLAKNKIDVQLLNPGYIKTRLTDKNPYKKIYVMTPEKAAEFSLSHMRSSRFQSSFPRGFYN
jgi:short-subunit dehydrogenase